FKGIISLNPLTAQFEFFGVNAKKGYLFKGYFKNVSEKGFTREYKVIYPDEDPMAKSFGQVISFKEDFIFKEINTMSFSIKYYNRKTKQWEMWSQQDFIVTKIEEK
ncbi:MAG: hypothetical protein KDC67_06465, partial [Ignavibacteriae bacterium]|nr:hypothetical protein [Ignavibacteriota bacterium]